MFTAVKMKAFSFLALAMLHLASATAGTESAKVSAAGTKPNFLVLFVDDFGWGDVGANWPETTETKNMDALLGSGIRFTDFHAMSVCTPSRASLLTGRLGMRTGVVVNFGEDALYGLPQDEITLASHLQSVGYDSKIIGKFHLGTHPEFHPTYRGFDEYVGIPYSVDMGCVNCVNANIPMEAPCPYTNSTPPPDNGNPALPLYNSTSPHCSGKASCNEDIVEQPVNMETLADRYVATATEYIMRHAVAASSSSSSSSSPSETAATPNPFFLYIPFSHMHVPLAHDPRWTNTSDRKTIFGDTLMELDNMVGEIIAALSTANVLENTLIFITADNGKWDVKCDLAGSSGPWVGAYQAQVGGGGTAKMTQWEGGHRVVGGASWKGMITPNQVSHATTSTLDIFPTISALAGLSLPTDRVYDGFDLSPILFSDGATTKVRDVLFHPSALNGNISVVRYQNYTAFFETYGAPNCTQHSGPVQYHDPPLIFDLSVDPGQSQPLAPPPAGLVQTFRNLLADMYLNISSTYHNVANYSGKIGAEPCCNASHAVCRCEG